MKATIAHLLLLLTAVPAMAVAQHKTLPEDSPLASSAAGVPGAEDRRRADSVLSDSARAVQAFKDSLKVVDEARLDSMLRVADTLAATPHPLAAADSTSVLAAKRTNRKRRDWSAWRPNPTTALWMALVFPGGGQIYNRKYWKLPVVYGGFVGCVYALTWNNMMYKDYSQAYIDLMDNDPNTASYNKFLHLGRQITPANEERYKTIFKSRKDKYRRWRDLSIFVMVGIYAVSVIDAYVDAELSNFDISKDLSLRIEPAVLPVTNSPNATPGPRNILSGDNALGLQCSLKF